jgi:F-box and WD-40 domain protein 1/11
MTPLGLSPLEPALDPPAQPSLLLDPHRDPMVNWQYLYKQKRRLEANWQQGKFKNFQLPHPEHPDEAHAECVYTIQYSKNYLVSGSRDKTLRIWNLNTQRLAVPPLKGHSASVLCLQFDDRPEHDLVVSGGSDCHVILWRFSTGKMITKLERAHSESVLNLRFDSRYLITCSKDKTIKIWNRQPLMPTDDAYPTKNVSNSTRFPSYIIDTTTMLESELAAMKPLREYSLLATLEGHNAAVNAIQILDSTIVSASGDRLIKLWDVKTGKCLKTVQGHQKGIACVQFDGKRIVSGSSDETVRIFDVVTGAEVACLRGHKNLVRTVQARFGDVPGSEADLESEARDVDRQFFQAQMDGSLQRGRLTREQRYARNAGSSNPNELFAVGARLPPGGGGSKWARIVSGSYDETVIIWKRDHEGKWVPAQQLLQSDAVVGAGGQPRQQPGGVAAPGGPQIQVQGPMPMPMPAAGQAAQLNMNAHLNFQQWLQQNGHMLTPQQVAQMQAQMAHNLLLLNAAHGAANNGGNAQAPPQPQQVPAAGPSSSTAAQAGGATPASASASASGANTPASSSTPTPQAQAQALPPPSLAQQTLQAAVPQQWGPALPLPHHPPNPPQAAAPQQHPHHHHHHHHHHHVAPAAPQQPTGANSRVFKLQFDARRIICCSQDPTIVGWDFAAGDAEIEEASGFFGEDF